VINDLSGLVLIPIPQVDSTWVIYKVSSQNSEPCGGNVFNNVSRLKVKTTMVACGSAWRKACLAAVSCAVLPNSRLLRARWRRKPHTKLLTLDWYDIWCRRRQRLAQLGLRQETRVKDIACPSVLYALDGLARDLAVWLKSAAVSRMDTGTKAFSNTILRVHDHTCQQVPWNLVGMKDIRISSWSLSWPKLRKNMLS